MNHTLDTAWLLAALLCLGACGSDDSSSEHADDKPDASQPGMNPCDVSESAALCVSREIETVEGRRVYWNHAGSTAPKRGRPAVILYQGSNYGPSLSWDVELPNSTPFGGYYQLVLIAELIDAGFVVIQPEAADGRVWTTNVPGSTYEGSADAVFVASLLERMQEGAFGRIDMQRLYATGISSGGYMTSRMAVSHAGRFRALAIQSASYATCLGPLCTVPTELPEGHPPTLLLHGATDAIVPIATARSYYEALLSHDVETSFIEDANAGHAWLSEAPTAVTEWFITH